MCLRCLRSPATPKWPGEAIYIAHKLEVAVGGISAQVLDHPTVWGVGLSGAKKNFLEPKTCSLDNNPVHLSDAFSTGVGLFGHSQNQLHGASYFDHYSQLRIPFSVILYSLESL